MAKFIFVLATVNVKELNPGGISFRHVEVEAVNADQAYVKGYQALGGPRAKANEIMNDYVIAV